ncbi:MAG TPA: threonine/serine dehydratase [Terriglobales bacterium]|nr:threonine/serine dehydratase [Terriglobales bacterium]
MISRGVRFPIVSLSDIKLAQSRLQGVAARTPLIPLAKPIDGRKLILKPESLQPVGSFKLRGAYNKIASLEDAERRRGVISYSSGNHAQAVAYAAKTLGVKATVVMPRNAPKIKVDGTSARGAEIVFVGPGSHERKARAEEIAKERGLTIVPPYNDEKIIAGQGTIGPEILEDLSHVELVLVPVGGGGLISGVAAALKLCRTQVKVIGAEPELANDAFQSLRAGRIVELPAERVSQTLADGLRTQSVGEIPFAHIQHYVDDIVTVSEAEIVAAMRFLALNAKLVAEPSGAVTTAAFLFHGDRLLTIRNTVAILSGGNVEPDLLAKILIERST